MRFQQSVPVFFLTVIGCWHTTEVSVREPALVGLRVRDKAGELVVLPTDCKPCAVDTILGPPVGLLIGGSDQHLTIARDSSGELRFEAPDTRGNTAGTLVTGGR